MAFLKLENINKKYPGVKALNDINLEIEKGKVIGLLGPNGSGKSTMIKIITGMLRDYNGKVYFKDRRWSHKSKAFISYLPDVFVFENKKSIKSIVRYYKLMFKDFNETKFYDLVKRFKIDERSQFSQLSKGNKEKLQLAFVLSRNAELYIFDEPIGGVDPVVRDIILETIMSYKNTDATVILATHQIYDVEKLFDEVIFLKEGEIALHESTKSLTKRTKKTLLECFKEVFRYVA